MKRIKPVNFRTTTSFLDAIESLIVLAIVVAISSVTPAAFAQTDVHASLIAIKDRKHVPQPRLISDSGRATRLSDYRGKVILLNFWATDCGGCVFEIPTIIDLQNRNGNKGFTVVGISMDIPYENLKNAGDAWNKVKPFITKKKINYPILMGSESIFKNFGLKQLPDTLLIDKTGKIAAVYVGVISKDNVEVNIEKLLSER